MKIYAIIPIGLAAALLSVSVAQPRKPASGSHAKRPAAVSKPAKNLRASAAKPRKEPAKPALTSLVLLYTSSATGQIRSCNCTKFRFGGYGRELTLLKSIRSKSPNTLLIEGGDVCGDTGFQADLKANVSAQALELLGYGVMIPGEEELGVRGVRYADRFNSKAVPLVCANVFKAGEDKPLFSPYVVLKTAAGLRVAVIGLMDKSLCDPWLGTSYGQVVKDPKEVLPAIVKQARAGSDLVVLVYHGPVGVDSQLAKVQGIDLILATHRHSQDRLFPGKDSNVVQAPVAKLSSATLVNSEVSTNWCLGMIDIEIGQDRKIKSAQHQLFYLDRSYDEDVGMVKVYDDYNEKVKQAVLAGAADFKKVAEGLLTKRGLNLVEMRQRLHKSVYATASKCVSCHSQINTIWANSKHATAMATLEKTHQEYDPECIRCHTTGATERNGFRNAKETPELVNVQCEACHGPGLEHIATPAKLYGKVTEERCRSCHTDERTPDFDYGTAWAQIMH